jgi:CheY-like chemotaxis protein
MDNQQIVRDSAVIIYVMVAFLGGGGTVIAAIALLANQILKSPVLVAALENLAKSAHPDLLKALNVSAALVEEITDDTPYADKLEARRT